jgi:AraC-like DNA-binding protein
MKSKLSHVENIIHKTGTSPFSLHRTVVDPSLNSALYLHCHVEAEFFYLEKGELDFHIEGRHFRLTAGDAVFIPPGMLHHAIRPRRYKEVIEYSAIVFSTEPLERSFPSNTPYFEALYSKRADSAYPILSNEVCNRKLISSIKSILDLRDEPTDTCEMSIQGHLFVCWQELYNLHLSKIAQIAAGNSLSRNLFLSMDYMQKHYSEALTLPQLAGISGYSESYYCHNFSNFTGSSPFEYLNRIRIVKACELLNSTDKKITDIALLTGFNNISYFNRTFVKIMGFTPSAYRRK